MPPPEKEIIKEIKKNNMTDENIIVPEETIEPTVEAPVETEVAPETPVAE